MRAHLVASGTAVTRTATCGAAIPRSATPRSATPRSAAPPERGPARYARHAIGVAGATVAFLLLSGPVSAQQEGHAGKPVYDKWCAGCHGVDGRGEGPGATHMLPRPRDFTRALYQIRSTTSGSLPTDADILHVINVGMPGTAMPGWEEQLTKADRDNLVGYLKTFSRYFETDQPQVVDFGGAPRLNDDLLAAGQDAYQTLECFKCHGADGRGDGASAPTQTDDHDFPIRPADLTQPWTFNGGGSVEDIHRRLLTGLDGTPMPSYGDAMNAGVVSEEAMWGLAHYVASLGGETPRVREVVAAHRAENGLPTAVDDAAWEDVERYWIPLAGQIVVKPRWFAPAVTGVWVQALHDGETLAMRVSWDDRSESPDPVWGEWRQRVRATVFDDERRVPAPAATPAAGVAADAGAEAAAGPAVDPGVQAAVAGAVDVLSLWFPPPGARDRPYFLMGNTRQPVRVWRWNSQEGGVEAVGRGLGVVEALPGGGALEASARFEAGQWQVLFRYPLAAADSAGPLIATGQPVPFALMAQDGDNGEVGARGAVSSWYFVQLTEPTPPTVYATPVLAVLLTAGLGLLLVRRAQRRAVTPETRTTAAPAVV